MPSKGGIHRISSKSTRRPINARSETAPTMPMFRDAFARRHCLVPADAFYEWTEVDGVKQPWAIARADGAPLTFAGLWEGWRGTAGDVVRSFTILTTTANVALSPLHERMPVVLEQADWPLWLGEVAGDTATLLRPSRADFTTWRVSSAVNSVRNDGATLLEPA